MRLVWPLIASSPNRHASPVRSIAPCPARPTLKLCRRLELGTRPVEGGREISKKILEKKYLPYAPSEWPPMSDAIGGEGERRESGVCREKCRMVHSVSQ